MNVLNLFRMTVCVVRTTKTAWNQVKFDIQNQSRARALFAEQLQKEVADVILQFKNEQKKTRKNVCAWPLRSFTCCLLVVWTHHLHWPQNFGTKIRKRSKGTWFWFVLTLKVFWFTKCHSIAYSSINFIFFDRRTRKSRKLWRHAVRWTLKLAKSFWRFVVGSNFTHLQIEDQHLKEKKKALEAGFEAPSSLILCQAMSTKLLLRTMKVFGSSGRRTCNPRAWFSLLIVFTSRNSNKLKNLALNSLNPRSNTTSSTKTMWIWVVKRWVPLTVPVYILCSLPRWLKVALMPFQKTSTLKCLWNLIFREVYVLRHSNSNTTSRSNKITMCSFRMWTSLHCSWCKLNVDFHIDEPTWT